jgi:hypothetical protein
MLINYAEAVAKVNTQKDKIRSVPQRLEAGR